MFSLFADAKGSGTGLGQSRGFIDVATLWPWGRMLGSVNCHFTALNSNGSGIVRSTGFHRLFSCESKKALTSAALDPAAKLKLTMSAIDRRSVNTHR